MKQGHQIRNLDGKFGERIPVPLMPLKDALSIAGNPPATWQPYHSPVAVRTLYEAGLCLMAQRRSRTADGKLGSMVGLWKASKQRKAA